LKGVEDTLKEAKRSVYFATGNRGKYLEAVRIASAHGVVLKHLRLQKQEIQSEQITEIASFAARQAAESTRRSVVVEDAGLFVKGLSGFPGPYSSYVFDTIGLRGILRLTQALSLRQAFFQASVAYCEPRRRPISFKGIVRGTLSRRPKGSHGFGYDPIFIPAEGDGRTFAEMSTNEKNLYSHRARAFTKFCRWFASNL
jgi:XTP/dITP diphosphohydrolase